MTSRVLPRRSLLAAAGVGLPGAALGLTGLACGRSVAEERAAGGSAEARGVRLVVPATATSDGAGVKLRRALGSRGLPMLDPFLLLDEMHSDQPEDYQAGFPTHPHRGFETVTYVIEGAVDHKDSLGNHGHLASGSVQWMTAGRGIVHSEMPTHGPADARLWGLQLWVNLPAARKMGTPRYQDVAPKLVPEIVVDDARVRLVAGEVGGARGPVEGIVTSPQMLDVALPAKGSFVHGLDPAQNAFVYVLEGVVAVGGGRKPVSERELAVLDAGPSVVVRSDAGARFLLLAATPIGEPVSRSGPFVMNTDEEIRRAWEDYRTGRLVQG
jgi:redox-sensitive bicupin YhaK (pirin superfamily)